MNTLTVSPSTGRSGKSVTLSVASTTTICELKELVCKEIKVRSNNTILLYEDGYLELEATLEEYEIPETATLTYQVRLCGPLPVDFDWSKAGYNKLAKKRGI
jgi:hypothetical protein